MRIRHRGDGGGIGARDWEPTAGGESGYIVADPKNPDIVYGGSYGGLLDAAQPSRPARSRDVNPWPDNPMGCGRRRHQAPLPVELPDLLLAERSEQALRRLASTVQSRRTAGRAGR